MLPLIVGESRTLRAEATNAGRPARVEGAPTWTSSNHAVLTVAPAADGLSAVITAVAPGEAQVAVTATAGTTALTAPPLDVVASLPLADALAIAPA